MRRMNERSTRSGKIMFRIGLVSLVITAILLAFGVAYASIPDSGGVIHACYDSGNHVLHVIDTEAGEVCHSQEKELSWNKRGPQGPQGPAGPRGPSDGYTTYLLPNNAKSLVGHDENVLTLSLPPGSYIFTASVRIERSTSGSSSVFCNFRVGGGPFGNGYLEQLDGADAVATVAATTGFSLTQTEDVHLTCRGFGDAGMYASLANMTAIKVGTLTRQ